MYALTTPPHCHVANSSVLWATPPAGLSKLPWCHIAQGTQCTGVRSPRVPYHCCIPVHCVTRAQCHLAALCTVGSSRVLLRTYGLICMRCLPRSGTARSQSMQMLSLRKH